MSKRNLFFLIITLLVLAAMGLAFYRSGVGEKIGSSVVRVGPYEFRVEVADTPLSRSRGLSGREYLEEDEGMLFVFDSAGRYSFWMKGMKFAIDIIWIRGDKIVGFTENIQPEPEKSVFSLTTYYPPEAVDRVLELSTGTVAKNGFQIGQGIEISY